MDQPIRTLLAGWQSFDVIVGSVAGALIGLQFVVMALVADAQRQATTREIAAFGTPTVLHFSAALLLSALSNVPWSGAWGLELALLLCGVAGVVYTMVVIGRARRTPNYRPQLEDWVWHAVFPMIVYLALTFAGVVLSRHTALALSLLGGVSLTLVFIGIHNSWDTIIYIATAGKPDGQAAPRPGDAVR